MSDTRLEFAVTLKAPVDRVFAAITDARHLEHWFCDACESEPRPNGQLVMRWTGAKSSDVPFEARWTELASPNRAAFRGGHVGYPDGDAGTVTFALVAEGAGTRLDVTHEFPAADAYARFRGEWSSAWPRALARLAASLEPVRATRF